MPSPYYLPMAALRPRLGLVIPTWFPDDYPPADATDVLATTLADLEAVFEPRHCLLAADGSGVAAAAGAELAAQTGCTLRRLEGGPHGKGGAVAAGFAELLERPELEWFVVRDHDGDHFLHDTPRLVRLAVQMAAETGAERVLVNGGRRDPARPMGWVRTEYERLVNRVIWRGLHYHAARLGRAVDEAWLEAGVPIPDLQSGYKVYSRAAAEHLVAATAEADWPMRRWGCEVLATVEIVAKGGVYGEAPRAALDEQPLTTYEGGASRVKIHGDILRWTARRLELPPAALLSWFDAAWAQGELRSLGEAVQPLLELREYLRVELDPALPPAPRAAWVC